MKTVLLIISLLSVTACLQGQISVGFIGNSRSEGPAPEAKSCLSALAPYRDIRLTILNLEEVSKKPSKLAGFDVVWIQRTDTIPFSETETDPKLIKGLREYVENGGNLLLNQEAFRYVNLLGLESEVPETRHKPCPDEGYGRKLGFHAFRDHPVFSGLFGGAYVQRPVRDTSVRITGFFGNKLPANGKVIGVDWDYIFLREESKLILEYNNPGTGKVIAVGGYMDFTMANLNAEHLARFTANAIRYLAGVPSGVPENYWYYGPYMVRECPAAERNLDRPFAAIPGARQWSFPVEAVSFGNRAATGNSWDLAGERMVIMGIEQSGIEEIWTHPFMALRDYEAGIKTGDGILWFSTLTPQITVSPSFFTRTYLWKGGAMHEIVCVSPGDPNGVVHYEYKGTGPATLVIRFKTNLRFMWPYSERSTGTLCHGWDDNYSAFTAMDRSGDMVLMAGANKIPSDHSAVPDTGEMKVTATLSYPMNSLDFLDFVITGTSEGAAAALNHFDRGIRDPEGICRSAIDHTRSVFDRSLVITSPNDTFNQGYLWSLTGADRFFVNTPGMGSSLVAGYSTTRRGWDGEHKVNGRPGYAWYFGRDGQWSGLALLDYGDFEKAKQVLAFYEKYQDLSGKIFHEATTSGVIHYDASDATPLYIVLAGRYFRYSNDTAYLRSSWPNIRKAIGFCLSTDTDKDHLIENTNVGHGWVEGGELYGSHATLYLNACWAAALEEAYWMAGFLKDPDQQSFMAERNEIMNIINRDFWRGSPALGGPGMNLGYYSYGKNRDGSFRTGITVLPAVPIYFGLTESMKAKTMLDHYGGNTFTTNWGVRIIGDDSPLFKPAGYHYGSVWPLFTGWTALAEYKSGSYTAGFSHIMNNLNVYRNWSLGYVEEVLNGAEYKPSGVCPHQCWSETMVLQPAIEGMLGLNVKANENRLTLSPHLPANWDSLKVTNIRIGEQRLNYTFKRQGKNSIYVFEPDGDKEFTVDFLPAFPAASVIGKAYLDGSEIPFTTFKAGERINLSCSFTVKKKTTLIVQAGGGISMLPMIQDPAPGDSAAGLRIVSARYAGNSYLVDVEGPAGTTGDFKVRLLNNQRISKLVHSDFFMTGGDIYLLRVNFKGTDTKYVRKTITIETVQ
jgi:glycogen debranching enzyme